MSEKQLKNFLLCYLEAIVLQHNMTGLQQLLSIIIFAQMYYYKQIYPSVPHKHMLLWTSQQGHKTSV